jgi:two-component system phosphate regulon sensor histidine kinase PhoR
VKRPVIILYLLAFYILFQFCWWAYLLVSLNDEVYKHRIENVGLLVLTPEQREGATVALEKKIGNRRWMVIGEGIVFLSLLIWGTSVMLKIYKKEMALARQQKNFLLSITHEFKSPLASIKLYLQTLLRHDLDKKKEISFINSAIGDTDRLNNLVENALMANLIDHKGYSFSKEDINISALLRLMIQKFQQIPGHEKIESHIEEGLYVHADKNALSILISNLIENGWKYSPKESPLEITITRAENKIHLLIADQGVGIPDAEKQNIFTKFYRIGNEETRRTKGTGLGLFIVKYIVEEHSGKISVFDNKPAGSIFRVELPLLG